MLNDNLDALFAGDTGPVRTAPVRENAVEFKSAEQRFVETCSKCRGTGNYRNFGRCFACKGEGRFTFKTSPETRAANRQQAAERKEKRQTEAFDAVTAQIEAFKLAQPAVYQWLTAAGARGFDFANSLMGSLLRFGSLTTGQIEAVERCIAKDAARATARAERAQQAPQADTAGIDRLKDAFDKAKAYAAAKAPGLAIRNPKITIGGMTISPAKAESKNPGALYVKAGGTYLGKIADGKFFSVRECSKEQEAQVLQFVANPAEAAKVYGQETGICCACNAVLKSEWRLRGIGPVCATKYGW